MTREQQLFAEIFPIEASVLPQVTAYQFQAETADLSPIGQHFAAQFRDQFGGSWVWAGNRLLTDSPPNPVRLMMAFDSLVDKKSGVSGIDVDESWQPSPELIAEFMAYGALERLRPMIQAALAQTGSRVRAARVERDYRIYPWVVDGQPSASFSILSRMIFDPDLPTYAAALDSTDKLVGVQVVDRNSRVSGVITGVSGTLAEHRDQLIELTQRDWMRDLLKSASDDELVVHVSFGKHAYDYPASALRVPVALNDPHRAALPMNRPPVELALKPQARAQMVKVVADIVKREQFVGDAFSTRNQPDLFVNYDTPVEIVLGNARSRTYDPKHLYGDFSQFGAYWWRERFQKEPIRIGLLNTFAAPTKDFVEAMQRVIKKDFQFDVEVVRERKVRVISQSNLESAVRVLAKEAVDVVLAFFQDPTDQREEDDADDDFIKSQTVGRGLPCLIVHETTFNDPDAMPGIIMGLLARAGNVPYLLGEPLDFTDYVVGLDLIHQSKRDGDELTGIARVFRNDGALMYYALASAPVSPGEGIPLDVLATLLPEDYFRGQRVILHCAGSFSREAMWALGGWEDEIGATFFPVELIHQGVPYIYSLAGGKIKGSPTGTVFRLNVNEAFVATTAAGDDDLPQPLHIRTEPPLTIEHALRSVLTFTRLHYGATNPPALPVTIHNAEYIRDSINRGVMPDTTYGDLPFWL